MTTRMPPEVPKAQPSAEDATRHSSHSRRTLDVLAGVGLAVILLIVYAVDAASSSSEPQNEQPELEVVEEVKTNTEVVPVAKKLRLAVTPPQFDDMGRLLHELGEGYQYSQISLDDCLDSGKLSEYDVVFFTCGGVPEHWLAERLGLGSRNSAEYAPDPKVKRRLTESLRNFVRQGGTLYASDWRFQVINIVFPELVSVADVATGTAQYVEAEIVDEGLRERLGRTVKLHFDLAGWYPAAFRHDDMTIYMRGEYRDEKGNSRSAPLLVKIPVGEGAILFTAFHNEKQNSEAEKELLKYLVFATVTAKIETEVKQTMVKGGFSPRKHSLLSTSKDSPSVTKTYICESKCNLQFVLAFQGARLRLTVTSPAGKKIEKVGTSTLRIDVPNASVGNWKYTVTAETVPYENFPFTLTVGEK